MQKTVVEMFAGVGGFRCGLNHIHTIEDASKPEKWETVWFSQWEPADKKIQWAHSCYVNRFGNKADLNGNYTTNDDIHSVAKSTIPNHTLLVGGFPCQNYSVASTLATSKGIEGSKGVLWWDIRDMLEAKQPPFVLLENVDRLVKSPASQRGRDFGIILTCFRDLGYTVEWRIINAAEYGFQQRRRRAFIFAYKNNTEYAKVMQIKDTMEIIKIDGFFAKSFKVADGVTRLKEIDLPEQVGTVSDTFAFDFQNAGVMKEGHIVTCKTEPICEREQITLGDIMDDEPVASEFFIAEDKLYYTDHSVNHSDESKGALPKESRQTWQYLKGGKRIMRTATNGHEYLYSEGPIDLLDSWDKPARTMLTSEGSFSRTTHIVKDKVSGKIRLLTPTECERIQGFPTNWTRDCLVDGDTVEMPVNKRRFMMGNALVVNLIEIMEYQLSDIIDKEK